jgi:hypothetical protein
MQWLQNLNATNRDNQNNIRREASRHYRNKKRENPKDKINELATNSKDKNIRDLYRGINESEKGYQPRSNLMKNETGDRLQMSKIFWISGRTTYLSYWMYIV